MRHYLLDTYHGPLVLTQRHDSWIISSPNRAPEFYAGSIPPSCLASARVIDTPQAVEIVGDCSLVTWSDHGIDEIERKRLASVA